MAPKILSEWSTAELQEYILSTLESEGDAWDVKKHGHIEGFHITGKMYHDYFVEKGDHKTNWERLGLCLTQEGIKYLGVCAIAFAMDKLMIELEMQRNAEGVKSGGLSWGAGTKFSGRA